MTRALRTRNLHPVSQSGNLTESVSVEAHLPQRGKHRVSLQANRQGGERLDSWKEIAAHLKRTIRTVQRWEKREGLPVHRHFHLKADTVFAFKTDIDTWLATRGQTPNESRNTQRLSRQAAKGLNPPPRVMRRMFSVLRLWLALVAQESYPDPIDGVVPDLRRVPDDPD